MARNRVASSKPTPRFAPLSKLETRKASNMDRVILHLPITRSVFMIVKNSDVGVA
jgi:hypothetical protein